MIRRLSFAIATTALLVTAIPVLAGPLRDRLRERMAERMKQPAAPGGVELAYGADPLQRLDFWKASRPGAPLILFVHGGGWKRGDKRNATGRFKAPHYTQQGYAFASMNYRLIPGATVEQQAADVAAAVAHVRTKAKALEIDSSRLVLMGHSAGAHLVALVGTDPSYLRAVGLSLADVAGVVPLDGAAYDVPAQRTDGPAMMQGTYEQAFGTDPARQARLSPARHATAPNAPAFLILHVDRDDGRRQSETLGKALQASGTQAVVTAIEGRGLRGHMEINRRLGDRAYPATALIDDWLKTLFS